MRFLNFLKLDFFFRHNQNFQKKSRSNFLFEMEVISQTSLGTTKLEHF